MFENIGTLVPIILIFLILMFAFKNKISIFSSFLSGASDGINCVISILPIMVALVTSVEMMKSSGLVDVITNLFSSITSFLNFPPECIPLVIMKPISGSGSNAILYSLLNKYGSESRIGEIASVVACSSEAIVYIVSTYCGAVRIRDTKRIIIYSIVSFIFSVVCASLIC